MIDDPRNVTAIAKIASLYGTDIPKADVDNGYPQMVAEFDGGSAAMTHHNLGSYTDHVKALGGQNVAAVPLPMGSAGHYTVVDNPVDGFVMFKSRAGLRGEVRTGNDAGAARLAQAPPLRGLPYDGEDRAGDSNHVSFCL